MMKNNPSVKRVMDTIVPITRFNRGEANKIFDEVNEYGVKIVLKNNAPACVLVDPQKYESMVETLEDYALYFEAEKRMKSSESSQTISSEQLMSELGISQSEIDEAEVEIE